LRTAKGWTQEQAGEHCRMPMQQYQRTESESVNLTFTTLARIAEGFGVDVAALFAAADTKE
jgi:transcriptional regulator with XRE-family HTH domain